MWWGVEGVVSEGVKGGVSEGSVVGSGGSSE